MVVVVVEGMVSGLRIVSITDPSQAVVVFCTLFLLCCAKGTLQRGTGVVGAKSPDQPITT